MIEEKHANIEQIADVVCDDLSTRVYIGITFLLLVSALGISRHKPIFLCMTGITNHSLVLISEVIF